MRTDHRSRSTTSCDSGLACWRSCGYPPGVRFKQKATSERERDQAKRDGGRRVERRIHAVLSYSWCCCNGSKGDDDFRSSAKREIVWVVPFGQPSTFSFWPPLPSPRLSRCFPFSSCYCSWRCLAIVCPPGHGLNLHLSEIRIIAVASALAPHSLPFLLAPYASTL